MLNTTTNDPERGIASSSRTSRSMPFLDAVSTRGYRELSRAGKVGKREHGGVYALLEREAIRNVSGLGNHSPGKTTAELRLSTSQDRVSFARPTDAATARHSTQKPQNSQNKTGLLCGFREFCVDRRG
jgi:hypothetical protein